MKSIIGSALALLSLASIACNTTNVSTPRSTDYLDKADAAEFEGDNSTQPEADAAMPIADAGSHSDASSNSDGSKPSTDAGNAPTVDSSVVPSNCKNDCYNCQFADQYCNGTTAECESAWRNCIIPINTGACMHAGFTCGKVSLVRSISAPLGLR